MASIIYKKIDGNIESKLVDIEFLFGELEHGGWSTDPECKDLDKNKDGVISEQEADTNDTGKLSTKEIRAAAKEAGIDGWDKKQIKTLEAALWPTQK